MTPNEIIEYLKSLPVEEKQKILIEFSEQFNSNLLENPKDRLKKSLPKILLIIGLIILFFFIANTAIRNFNFYYLIKWFIAGSCIYLGTQSTKNKKVGFSVLYFIIAVMFNPVFNITGIFVEHQWRVEFDLNPLIGNLLPVVLLFPLVNELSILKFKWRNLNNFYPLFISILLILTGSFVAKNMGVLGPSDKELEVRRIADSCRIADSIAKVQAENQRIADSIAAAAAADSAAKAHVWR